MAISISISITQNSQNVANNTSNVTVKVNASWTYGSYNALQKPGWLKIDGTTYDFYSPFNTGQSTSGSQTLFTKTVDVPHDSTGAKVLSCSASYTSGVSSGTVTASASKTLTTIPRKSTLAASNGTLGKAQTLTVTRQASSFTHTIIYKCGTTSGTICSKSGTTSISWTPPLSLASQNTTGTSVSITLTITTYSGNTNVGSNTKTISCSIPSSVVPSCSIAVTDPTGYADTYGGYLKGLSRLKVVVTPTTAYESPIASYRTVANGSTYTAASFTTGVLTTSGSITIKTTVTDKRSRSGTASETLLVLDYLAPAISRLTVKRCDENGADNDQGEYVQVKFSATVSSLDGQNGASYSLNYKRSTDINYTEVDISELQNMYSVTDATYIFPADSSSSYDVKLVVVDNFNTTSKTTSASTGFTLIHWLASGLGIAIGKISELAYVLDIGFKTRFMGGILHPVLEPDTDLNDVRTPNTYVGANITNYKYLNCPLTSGTFTLEVVGMGEDGQVKQRLTYCHKTLSKAWERIYYASSWGDWICVSDFDGQLLWSGSYYMSGSQIATLSEPVSKQRSGIVLVFSRYSSSTAQNYHFNTFFVPKYQIAQHAGCGHTFMMTTDGTFGVFASKYLYINDTTVAGNNNNEASGVGDCGIKYANNGFVLRYVIGV